MNARQIAEAPYDRVVALLPDAKAKPARGGCLRAALARCPGHTDRAPSLSIAESATDQRVLLRCFAGCAPETIVNALGLEVRDLFIPTDPAELRRRDDERNATRRRYARDPKGTRDALLLSALDRRRAELEQQHGYAGVPLLAGDLDAAARHVARIVDEPEPKPIALEPWETGLPHVAEPLWPLLFSRAVEIAARERWHRAKAEAAKRWPDAAGVWAHLDADPHGAQRDDYDRAETIAAEMLHPNRIKRGFVARSHCAACGLFHTPGTAHPFAAEQAANRAALSRLRLGLDGTR
ncbi:MAG: hypothetical protein JWO85_2638 [Candidatus Eremiobacteraeota bacterium]|nr:hypothetical protein [Candidatus Eremiobacteraeota bacterium]